MTDGMKYVSRRSRCSNAILGGLGVMNVMLSRRRGTAPAKSAYAKPWSSAHSILRQFFLEP